MTRFTFIFILFVMTSCHTTKQTITSEEVKSGLYLEQVSLISLDNFFNQWVYNKKIQKIDLNIRELNKDNKYTYFGKPSLGLNRNNWTFFKVHSDTLSESFPNYKDFYGEELQYYLWEEVIPEEDIDLWNKLSTLRQNNLRPKWSYKKNKPIFNYSLVEKTVVLTMTWEIECEEFKSLNNKTYKASYNLLTKQYE